MESINSPFSSNPSPTKGDVGVEARANDTLIRGWSNAALETNKSSAAAGRERAGTTAANKSAADHEAWRGKADTQGAV